MSSVLSLDQDDDTCMPSRQRFLRCPIDTAIVVDAVTDATTEKLKTALVPLRHGAWRHSRVLQIAFEESDTDHSDEEAALDVSQVSFRTMSHVVMYLNQYSDATDIPSVARPLCSTVLEEVFVSDFDRHFLKQLEAERQVVPVLEAANFLDIPSLLSLVSAYIAFHIRGQPVSALAGILHGKLGAPLSRHPE